MKKISTPQVLILRFNSKDIIATSVGENQAEIGTGDDIINNGGSFGGFDAPSRGGVFGSDN